MKNQYFGDLNDFRKIGLIRSLTGFGRLSTAVCWMLTPDDTTTDGKFIDYLQQPDKYRQLDPELFDKLKYYVSTAGERRVSAVDEGWILPSAKCYYEVLLDDAKDRSNYFQSFWELAEGCDFIFFDPDNGMEVKSKPAGKTGSSKYLYWAELVQAYSLGCSVLVYQSFRRTKRDEFIRQMANEFISKTGAPEVYSFRTKLMALFLLPSQAMSLTLDRNISLVEQTWFGELEVVRHSRSDTPMFNRLYVSNQSGQDVFGS